MLSMVLMLALRTAAASGATAPADLRTRTAAVIPCRSTTDRGEVVVCALRHADRYRVPFVQHDAGDPKHETVMAERDRLLARTDNCAEKSAFLVGCGMAGVSAGATFGSSGTEVRKLAP